MACLNSILTGNLSKVIDDDLVKFARDFPKDILKTLTNKIEKGILNDNSIKKFYENFVKNIIIKKKILVYFVRYKKTEFLVHRMAGVSFLMKSFKFTNILEAIKTIQERDENVERKLFLINNSFKVKFTLKVVYRAFNGKNKAIIQQIE